jgi:hypothetical protein
MPLCPWVLETMVGHETPPQRGPPTMNCHDHISSAWVLLGFHVLGEGPQDHEVLHHATLPELVPGTCGWRRPP